MLGCSFLPRNKVEITAVLRERLESYGFVQKRVQSLPQLSKVVCLLNWARNELGNLSSCDGSVVMLPAVKK